MHGWMRCCAWLSSTGRRDGASRGTRSGCGNGLGLAAALLGDPELLVLDEPANGLDPEGVRWLRDFLRAFAAGSRTVLVSSHVLAEVAQTVDQVLIINHGRLVVESSLDQLTAHVGGSIRVRTPALGKLQEALRREGIDATSVNEQGLLVHGVTSEKLGDLAFAAGVPIYELVAEGSSLEDVFLELTTESEARAVIAQTQAELLKIRSTRTTIGIVLGMIALILLFSLLSGLLTKPPHLTSTEDQRGLLSVGSTCRGLLGAGWDHARDQRVSLRHDPPDLPLHPETLAGGGRQARRRPARWTRVRRRR